MDVEEGVGVALAVTVAGFQRRRDGFFRAPLAAEPGQVAGIHGVEKIRRSVLPQHGIAAILWQRARFIRNCINEYHDETSALQA